MVVGDLWFSLGCTEPGEIKPEMSTVKHVPEVNGAERNDRDGAARAGDAVHDARVGSKREHHDEVGHLGLNSVKTMKVLDNRDAEHG